MNKCRNGRITGELLCNYDYLIIIIITWYIIYSRIFTATIYVYVFFCTGYHTSLLDFVEWFENELELGANKKRVHN